MSKYLKLFDTHSQYESYTADTEAFIKPNISFCLDTPNEVNYNPYVEPVETRVVAKFNVTSTSSPTKIVSSQYYTSGFSAIEIDGVELPSVVSAYTFGTTGEHTVKYTLADPTTIGKYSFEQCYNLTSIEIPDSVTTIDMYAFNQCDITSITIGSGLDRINQYGIYYCTSLTSLKCNAVLPPIIGYNALNTIGNCQIYVPSGSVDTYKAASGWSTYASRIQAIP